MDSGLAWRSEYQNASAVWPDRVRPLRSVIVPDTITGSRTPSSSNSSSSAYSAALALSVSNTVSTIRMSAPPWSRARPAST